MMANLLYHSFCSAALHSFKAIELSARFDLCCLALKLLLTEAKLLVCSD